MALWRALLNAAAGISEQQAKGVSGCLQIRYYPVGVKKRSAAVRYFRCPLSYSRETGSESEFPNIALAIWVLTLGTKLPSLFTLRGGGSLAAVKRYDFEHLVPPTSGSKPRTLQAHAYLQKYAEGRGCGGRFRISYSRLLLFL